MTFFANTLRLTHSATLQMLTAAVAKAEAMGQPQCIVIVDASGEVLGKIRMTGAKFLSLRSAFASVKSHNTTRRHQMHRNYPRLTIVF